MILFCSVEILGQTDSDVKTQLACTALLWGDQKESEAADQNIINYKKLIVAVYIKNSPCMQKLCAQTLCSLLQVFGEHHLAIVFVRTADILLSVCPFLNGDREARTLLKQ